VTARHEDAPARARASRPDVVVFDWPSSAREGYEGCIALRKVGSFGLLVTVVRASGELLRTMFEAGADDVVRKPFDLDELLLRVSALGRRRSAPEGRVQVGAIVVDGGEVLVENRPVTLTQRELAMLTHLARRANRTVTRGDLVALTWGRDPPSSNVVVAHVNHLRDKLGPAGAQLRTVRGVGYVLSGGREKAGGDGGGRA
jgi:DNA-binding response OmpR family regulator